MKWWNAPRISYRFFYKQKSILTFSDHIAQRNSQTGLSKTKTSTNAFTLGSSHTYGKPGVRSDKGRLFHNLIPHVRCVHAIASNPIYLAISTLELNKLNKFVNIYDMKLVV